MNRQTDSFLPTIKPRHLQRLLQASRALSSTLELREIIDLVIDVAAELTDSQSASLLLTEEGEEQLRFVATSDVASRTIIGMLIPVDNSVAGWVLTNDAPFISQALQPDHMASHYQEIISRTGWVADSMLAVPLHHKGQILGVLEAVNKRDRGEYSDHDVAVVQALASQAAVAIANARLFQQSDAIAEVMHEIKTPLTALSAGLELLERPELPLEMQQQIIQTMKSEARRMTKLTQDFLELSRFDSGRIRLNLEQVNLREIMQAVAESQKPSAGKKQVEIALFMPESAENLNLVADSNRLKQVLLNLVSNAIKYNRPGGRVALRAQREGNHVRLSVADTGRGISEEDQKHLFKRFYRVPSSEDAAEGSGLGLAITQRIVAAHGGRIELESELGKGSVFHCILPIEG